MSYKDVRHKESSRSDARRSPHATPWGNQRGSETRDTEKSWSDKSSKARKASSSPASQGPSQRQLRVAEEIRRVLADIITRLDFHDPDLQGLRLTISEVRISPDLKQATVFCWPFADGVHNPAPATSASAASPHAPTLHPAIIKGLDRAEPFIRHQLARSAYLRTLPKLHFVMDATFNEAQRMMNLLATLAPAPADHPSSDT